MKLLIRISIIALLTLLVGSGFASGQTNGPAKTSELAKSRIELIAATQEYKAKTEQLGRLQEEEITRAAFQVAEIHQLVLEGIVARAELEESEQSLVALQAKLATSRQEIAAADQKIAEIKAAEELTKRQSLAAFTSSQTTKSRSLLTPTILRYGGTANWSLTHLSNIQVFFTSRFGRTLPISTIGQSATHNQLGYDHRNAVDVALHPDTVEGQTLINYLRSQGIPFLAFRGAIPGVSTGPHVHIGHPSHRL